MYQWRKVVQGSILLFRQPSPLFLPSSWSLQRHASRLVSINKRVNWRNGTLVLGGSMAGLATAIHCYTTSTTVHCSSTPTSSISSSSSLPHLTLYEYPSCPFCGKVRAFCDYHNINYTAVSVNPISRKEIQFSNSKKLPLIIIDNQKIHDSSLVVSVLQTSMERGLSVSESLKFYPLVNVTTTDGKNTTEHSNKYFIMYGETQQSRTLGELREEREWREWVDNKLVHTLPPNIYRTVSEARHTMSVITNKSSMNTSQRFLARNIGPFALYYIGKRNIKKYNLKENARESLYDCCNEWVEAVGPNRQFMGGAIPNLADLAMFGALRATEGLATFKDMLDNTNIGPWYSAMSELVNGPRPIT